MTLLSRRKVLCGLLAAPAIVRASSIMSVKTMLPETLGVWNWYNRPPVAGDFRFEGDSYVFHYMSNGQLITMRCRLVPAVAEAC
jgi:hypothetical protein